MKGNRAFALALIIFVSGCLHETEPATEPEAPYATLTPSEVGEDRRIEVTEITETVHICNISWYLNDKMNGETVESGVSCEIVGGEGSGCVSFNDDDGDNLLSVGDEYYIGISQCPSSNIDYLFIIKDDVNGGRIASVDLTMDDDDDDDDDEEIEAGFETSVDGEDRAVRVTNISRVEDICEFSWYLKDSSGNTVEFGDTCAAEGEESACVTFYDNDGESKLSEGDQYMIDGGCVGDDYSFDVKHDESGHIIGSASLGEDEEIEASFETSADDEDRAVRVTSINRVEDMCNFSWYLKDQMGNTAEFGDTCAAEGEESECVTFYDNDFDGDLSEGDQYMIDDGCFGDGYSFDVKHDQSGHIIGSADL